MAIPSWFRTKKPQICICGFSFLLVPVDLKEEGYHLTSGTGIIGAEHAITDTAGDIVPCRPDDGLCKPV
jgi:hypothetical protein